MKLGKLKEAEDSLNQANILDNLNPDIWAEMAILCLLKDNRMF